MTNKSISVTTVWSVLIVVLLGLGASLPLLDTREGVALALPPSPAATVNEVTTSTLYIPIIVSTYANPFGVQFYGTLSPERGVADLSQANAGWIRIPVPWSQMAPVQVPIEQYNWSVSDSIVRTANEANIQLLYTISQQPNWISDHPMGPPRPTAMADVVAFVRALVERYDGDGVGDAPGSPIVRSFELYNEPDNTSQSLYTAPWGYRAGEYAALLKLLYPVVKSASPQAQLVVGGLAHDWFLEDGGPFNRGFLDELLAACRGHDCFDAMNFHYYPGFRDTWEPYGPDLLGKATYFRQKLAVNGMASMPLICTETSWWGTPAWGGDEMQSRYVVQSYTRGIAADLKMLIWFAYSDSVWEEEAAGLFTTTYQPKPSYHAFRTTEGQLQRATYQRPLSAAEKASPNIEGYVFTNRSGHRLDVVWTEGGNRFNPADDPVVFYTAYSNWLRVVDKYGVTRWVGDADDGLVDGKVTVAVGGDPLFLEYVWTR
jgi:hypothetical protein